MRNPSNQLAVKKRLFIAGGIIAAIGAVIFVAVMLGKARVRATAKWPSVMGRIVTSEKSTATIKTGPVARTEPIAKVVYSYSVEGRKYQCDRRRVLPMFHSTAPEPEEVTRRYRVGHNVKVFYNPQSPADALLVPHAADDAKTFMSGMMYFAPVIVLIGVGMMVGGAEAVFPRLGRLQATSPVSAQPLHASIAPPQPAAVQPPPTPAQPQFAPVPPQPVAAKPQPRHRTHWLIRAVACVAGVMFLLFGGLVLLVAVAMLSDVANRNIAHYVVMTIFAGISGFGAYMLRIGLWRHAKRAV